MASITSDDEPPQRPSARTGTICTLGAIPAMPVPGGDGGDARHVRAVPIAVVNVAVAAFAVGGHDRGTVDPIAGVRRVRIGTIAVVGDEIRWRRSARRYIRNKV